MKIQILVTLILFVILMGACSGAKRTLAQQVYDESHNRQFWTADWSPDNNMIAIGGVDSILRIYHSSNLKLHSSYQIDSWIHVVKWHPEGQILSFATLDKYAGFIDIKTGEIKYLNSKGGSRAMGWNHDGTQFAVADLESGIKIWNESGNLIKEIQIPYEPETPGKSYLSLDWHPTENIFVATNFQINLINAEGEVLRVMEHKNPAAIILCSRWHPSGSFFVLGDYGHNWEGENVPSLLHFWSKNGTHIKSIPGSKAEIRNLAWNPDGSRLATASDLLRIWSDTGELLHEAPADANNKLWGIDWDQKGEKIVTSSRFKTIAIWDKKAGQIKRIQVPESH
jgi:WD40 repeat protein